MKTLSYLSGFAVIKVSGDDRHAFLHGQFINDLNLIDTHSAQFSGWCNPKGQLIANFLIINTGKAYLLVFKDDLKEVIQHRLNLFVFRSKVNIEDISEASALVGIRHNNKPDFQINLDDIQSVEDLTVVSLPDGSDRLLIQGHQQTIEETIARFGHGLKTEHSNDWVLSDILAGLPWITSATSERFLPQMLNLDRLNGLSYQKGCYPGQEVIARLHYRGDVKKRLQLIASEQALAAGAPLYSKASKGSVGTVINSTRGPDSRYYALAVLALAQLADDLFGRADETNPVTVLELSDIPVLLGNAFFRVRSFLFRARRDDA